MNLGNIADTYNSFQNIVGQGGELDFEHVIPELFSEFFQKIANGIKLVSHRDELRQQLDAVRNMAGNWRIDVKEIALLQDPYRCFIRYFLVSEKAGIFDVLAILRVDRQGLIDLIDEIYYHVPEKK